MFQSKYNVLPSVDENRYRETITIVQFNIQVGYRTDHID